MFKKLKLVFFLIPFLFGGIFWSNFSVPSSLSAGSTLEIIASNKNVSASSFPGARPFHHIENEVYKTDDQRIAIFQENWNKDPKKHYFAWASIFGLETVILDSTGASYAYAESIYKESMPQPDSFYALMSWRFWNIKENEWSDLLISQWVDKELNKSTYKVWLNNSNVGKLTNFWYHSKFFGKVIYRGTQYFAVIYKITDFISEIKRIVKTKNKDSSTLDIDFTKFQGKARDQLLAMLDWNGNLRSGIWDNIDKQIQNHPKWKGVEGIEGEVSLLLIRTLLFKVQELGIEEVSHPFFPEGYDFSFLKDNSEWKTISFKNLLKGITIKINGTNVEFYSHLFPDKIVFQVPITVSERIGLTTNIIAVLEKAISDYNQQQKQKYLIIGLSVGGGILFLSVLGGFLYWFFKIKK